MFLFFMNMLAFYQNRAMTSDFLRVSQYFTMPPKVYKKIEAVVRLGREVEKNKRRATSE